MNVEQIMKLVDNYVSACVDLESENNNYGTVDGSSVRYTDDVRNEAVAAIEKLAKDAERYRWLLNDGTTRFWGQCSLMDPGDVEEAIDAAIAALRKKERVREQIRAHKAQKEQV